MLVWMASPEANSVALGASGSLDCVVEDLSGTLRGWKKKFSPKKTGSLKRKDVTYIAPNGEEIKSRRHLLKYLKIHRPGSLKAGDFCWTSVEAPRRSARLNLKPGRHIRFEELEMLPMKRRKRNINANGNMRNNTMRSGRGRKPGGKSRVKDNDLMLVVKEEPVVEMEMADSVSEVAAHLRSSNVDKEDQVEIDSTNNKSLKNLVEDSHELGAKRDTPEEMPIDVKDVEEAIALGMQTALSILPVSLAETDAAAEDAEINLDIPTEQAEPCDDLMTELDEAHVQVDNMKEETPVVLREPHAADIETVVATDMENSKVEREETEVADEDAADAVVDATLTVVSNTATVEEVPKGDDMEAEVSKKNDVASPDYNTNLVVEEILKEETIADFVTGEPLEEEETVVEKVNIELDVDMLNVYETAMIVQFPTQEVKEESLVDAKQVDLPQPQGIHALVDDTVTFGGKAKPAVQSDTELVSQMSLEVSQRLLEPIGVLQ